MLSVIISYKFDAPLKSAHLRIPQKEAAIADYISGNLFDAEMIEVSEVKHRGLPFYTEFVKQSKGKVFIEFITPMNVAIFESAMAHENALTEFILSGLNRENIFLEDHWEHKNYDYFIVRLVRITGLSF